MREVNEDGVGVFVDEGVVVVCDGMGGSSSGAAVPPVVVSGLRAALRGLHVPVVDAAVEALRARVLEVNRALVASLVALGPWGSAAGGAAGVVWLRGGDAVWAHAGDTRLYLWREGRLARVWTQHTLGHDPEVTGALSPAQREAAEAQFPNVITRALGLAERFNPDVGELPLRAGDGLLLVSDGVWRQLSDAAIEAVLRAHERPDDVVAALFEALAGTPWYDNASAVVVRVLPGAPQDGGLAVNAARDWAKGRWLDPARPRLDEASEVVADSAGADEAWERLCARGCVPSGWHDDEGRRFAASTEAFGAVTRRPASPLAARLGAAPEGTLAQVEALAREVRRRLRPWGFAGAERVIWAPLPEATNDSHRGELAAWGRAHSCEDDASRAGRALALAARWERWRQRLGEVVSGAAHWASGAVVPAWNRAVTAHPYADLASPWEPLWEVAARGYVVVEVAREGVVVGVP